jgi:enoyl-CoA hydratase/carnithine racemase
MTQTDPQSKEILGLVIVDDRDGVSQLTLNRPDALNAFNGELFAQLDSALERAAEHPAIGCVVLTGAGRAFTAGSDISDEPAPDAPNPYDALIERVEGFPKPLIVAVNGLAVGIGTTILGHADIAIAAQSARFRMPFAPLGLVPEAGSTVTMPALMGRQRAASALFTGQWISSAEAQECGLVMRVVSDDSLLDESFGLAAKIAAQPLESLVQTKRLLLASRLPAVHESRLREEAEFRRLLSGPAHAEALAAFREKREPNFRQALA